MEVKGKFKKTISKIKKINVEKQTWSTVITLVLLALLLSITAYYGYIDVEKHKTIKQIDSLQSEVQRLNQRVTELQSQDSGLISSVQVGTDELKTLQTELSGKQEQLQKAKDTLKLLQ